MSSAQVEGCLLVTACWLLREKLQKRIFGPKEVIATSVKATMRALETDL